MTQSLAIFPLKGYSFQTIPITQRYSISHRGIDLAAPEGTEVDAPLAGTITFAGFDTSGYGNLITEKSGQFSYLFGHLKSFLAFVGEKVQQGQALGYEGQTGNATGPHLHFELRENNVPIDPTTFLRQARANPDKSETVPGTSSSGQLAPLQLNPDLPFISLPKPTGQGWQADLQQWLNDTLTASGKNIQSWVEATVAQQEKQIGQWLAEIALKGGLSVVALVLIVVGVLRITE